MNLNEGLLPSRSPRLCLVTWLAGLLCLSAVLAGTLPACGQGKGQVPAPARLSPADAAKQGKELVAELLAKLPESETNTGTLRIRPPGGQEREIPVKFSIYLTGSNWVSTYEALIDTAHFQAARLTVIHTAGKPNEYLVADEAAPAEPNAAVKRLAGAETMIPFAGSEFWVADLGLEFLHWPKQLLLRKELRKGQSCDVLESVNPAPSDRGYSRVVSWIDIDTGGIVHADAYDGRNALLKLFDPTALQKVNGQRELKEMEMRNRRTGARSWIQFNLGAQ